MKLKLDGVIVIINLCDDHGIPEDLGYDNAKEKLMPETMIQRRNRNFYVI